MIKYRYISHKFESFCLVQTVQKSARFFGQNTEKITVQEGFLHLAQNRKKPIDKFYIKMYHIITRRNPSFNTIRIKFYILGRNQTMKIIRRLLCVLLSIATLLCCCAAASAAEPRTITYMGILSIFAYSDGVGSSAGTEDHAFLSFKNTSSQQIKLGGLNIGPGLEITMGNWGTKPAGHTLGANDTWYSGLYFNIESHLANYDGGL